MKTFLVKKKLFGEMQEISEKQMTELVQSEEYVDFKDASNQETALMRASAKGYTDAVRVLIEKGSDVNAQDKWGKTALMRAAFEGKADTVIALINAGADVNIQDENGETALMKAAHWGRTEVVYHLLAAKADVNLQDKYGQTALMKANHKGSLEIVRSLLLHQADVNKQDFNGNTALNAMIRKGLMRAVDLLLEKGADVNAQNKEGQTPLMLVAKLAKVDIARALLDRGADMTLKDKKERNALDYVEDERLNGIYEVLKKEQVKLAESHLSEISSDDLLNPQVNRKVFEKLLKLKALAMVFEATGLDTHDKIRNIYGQICSSVEIDPKSKKIFQEAFNRKIKGFERVHS